VSELLEMNLLANSLRGEILRVGAVAGFGLRRARGLARVGVGCSLLLVALSAASFVPTAFGQGQAGAAAQGQSSSAANSAAKPQAAAAQSSAQSSTPAATETSAQKPADAAALSEPQMQDQSAPAAESLGEAARRARAQKGGPAKPKVYTDDSVTSLSGHGVSVVGAGNGGGGGTSYGGNSYAGVPASAAGNNQEAYWRGRANEIRRQMAACDQRISEIQDEIAKHGAVSVDPQSGAQAGVIFVEDRNAQIKQVESQKEGFERQLDELAEEGRKAGADSGWFR